MAGSSGTNDVVARAWVGKVFIATSVDGFIARRNGEIDWLTDRSDDAGHARGDPGHPADHGYAAHMSSVDHVVMGRGTYDKVVTFDAWPYPDHSVVVMSTSLQSSDDRIAVRRSVGETVALLNERAARGVYVDGGQTIQAFLRHGLIDELVITRIPILIGDGLPLFGPLASDVRLVHEGTDSAAGGLVQTRYRVLR